MSLFHFRLENTSNFIGGFLWNQHLCFPEPSENELYDMPAVFVPQENGVTRPFKM